jgi:hypothetical protein
VEKRNGCAHLPASPRSASPRSASDLRRMAIARGRMPMQFEQVRSTMFRELRQAGDADVREGARG